MRRQWRAVRIQFPVLIVAVSSVQTDGKAGEFVFRFEVTGYPGVAPEVRIWDPDHDAALPADRRPKGSERTASAFKNWGQETVYRPWDRHAGAHSNWNQQHPDLAWNPSRDLAFILGDLHALLNLGAG
jgi:hypothetical protein